MMKKNHITRTIIASAVLFSFNAAAATSYFEARNDAMGGHRGSIFPLWCGTSGKPGFTDKAQQQ